MKILVPPDLSKKFAKAKITDTDLKDSVSRAERGQIDARIGKFLIKQRIPRHGQGRSKGFRSIICYKTGNFALFVYVFAKSKKQNLTDEESEEYNAFASMISNLSDEQITRLAERQGWRTVE